MAREDMDALNNLGIMAEESQGGFTGDIEVAIKFYFKSHEKGHMDAPANIAFLMNKVNDKTDPEGKVLAILKAKNVSFDTDGRLGLLKQGLERGS